MEYKIIGELMPIGERNNKTTEIFGRMLEFYHLFDQLENTNHSKIIYQIYLNPKNYKQSIVYLALSMNISETTFYRYRKKYIELFKIVSQEMKGAEEAAPAQFGKLPTD